MNTRIKLEDVPEALRRCDYCFVKDVLNVNWKPHAPMVGSRMVVYASDHRGGMLGNDVFDIIGCESKAPGELRCGKKYADHVCDTVLLVALTRDCTLDEILTFLTALVPWVEEHQIEGFSFLEGFKITE